MEDSQQWDRAEGGRLDQLGTAVVAVRLQLDNWPAEPPEGADSCHQFEGGKLVDPQLDTAAAHFHLLDKAVAVVQLDSQAEGGRRCRPEGRGQEQPDPEADKQQ